MNVFVIHGDYIKKIKTLSLSEKISFYISITMQAGINVLIDWKSKFLRTFSIRFHFGSGVTCSEFTPGFVLKDTSGRSGGPSLERNLCARQAL